MVTTNINTHEHKLIETNSETQKLIQEVVALVHMFQFLLKIQKSFMFHGLLAAQICISTIVTVKINVDL